MCRWFESTSGHHYFFINTLIDHGKFNFPLQPVEPLPNFVIRIGIQAGLFEEIARAMCKGTPGLSPVPLLVSLARFLKKTDRRAKTGLTGKACWDFDRPERSALSDCHLGVL